MVASEEMQFEKAIEYRDLLNSVKQIAQKQKITHNDGEDKDIIALAKRRQGCGRTGVFLSGMEN